MHLMKVKWLNQPLDLEFNQNKHIVFAYPEYSFSCMSHSLRAICGRTSFAHIDAMADEAGGQTVPLIKGNSRA